MAQASALLILFLVACNYGRAWPSMKQPRGENREELLLHSRAAAASLPFEVQSMDGKGNNVANPMWGAVGNPYQRSVPPLYGPGQSPSGASRPGARVISNALFSRKPYLQNTEGVTDFLPAWGVMLHLDITILPRNASEPFPIAVPTGDPIFDPTGQGGHTINFLRSQYVAVNATTNSRVVTNAFTSFIDCSGLYGNSMDEMASMRLFSGGLLKFQILPTGEFPPRFVGGPLDGHFTYNSDIINMMPHLTVTYTLFFREHNRRARILAARHPDWSDEMLFQRARRWVIAVVQKTTAYFYFPDLTGQQLPPYSGYDPTVDPTIDLFFANVAFRYGHSAINPLVLRLDDYGNQVPEGHLIFRDAFYKSICDEVTTYGIESILRGFATQNDQVIDTTFVEDMRSFLPLADPGGHFDIAAIGLQRARELGIPDYNTCRKAFNLAPARTWSDVTSKTEVQRILSQLYTNISDFDAYVGAFAEDHIHKNSLIGPLMRVSLMDQFRRLRDGDRFWYENVGVLTSEDHADLSNYTLGSMVLSNSRIPHYPSDPFVGVNASSLYFLSGSATVPNSGSSGFDGSVQVLGRLRLGWNISMDDGTVTFEFASNASGWFGFGFGLNMLGTDIYFCTDSGNGSFTVYDSWSTQTQPPTSDVSQGSSNDIFKVADVTNLQTRSLRVVTFTRKLDTGDPLDAVIKTGSTPVIFAFSDSLDLIWHGPVNRVAGYVNFFSTSSSDFVAVKTSASMSLKLLHGVTMYIAFALVFPIGVFVVRYYHVNKWLVIHETMMKMVTSNVFVAALTAFIGNYGDSTFLHYKLGLVTVGLVLLSSLAGLLTVRLVSPKYSFFHTLLRMLHRTIGFSAYLSGLFNGYLGVNDISAGTSYNVLLTRAYLGTVWICPVALIIYGEFLQGRFRTTDDATSETDKLPEFSWEEINRRVAVGAQWLVIDGFIYDVEKFLPTHPGGSNSIVRMIGLDATRYFFGADRSQLRMTMMRGGDRASVVSASGSGGGTDDAASLARRRTQGRGRRVKTADSASGSMARAREPTPPKTKGASGAGGIADLRREAAVADTHAHSRFAQHLLNEMVVGRVRQEEAAEVSYLDLARTVGNYGVLSIGRRLSSGKQSVDGSTVQTGDTMERGAAATAAAGTPGGPKKRPPLSMSKFRHFAVGSRTMVATDSMQRQLWRINVLLPNEDDEARFRPGESIHFQFVGENKKIVTRAYTPVRVVNVGSIDFIVKNYNGEMTTHLMTCQTIRMRGPVMNVDIASPHTENKLWKKLGLIAAGTGLTPMLLIIDYYLMKAKRDPATNRPNVQISLLWVNSTETDLFALAELAKMEASACGSLSVVHLLSRPTSAGLSALPELSTLVGTINEEVVAATMPRPVVTSGLRNAGGAGSANSGTWNRMAAQGAATAASTQGSGIVAEYAIEQSLQRAATAASGPAAVQAARENRSSTSGFRPIFGGDELIARRAGTLSRGSLPRNAGGGGGGTGAGVATGTAGGVVPGSGNGGWAGLSPGGGRILMASMSESVPPSVQEDVPGSIIVSGGGGGGLGVPSRVPSFEIGSGAVSVSGWAEGFQPQSSVQASTASSAAPQDAVAIVICGPAIFNVNVSDMLRGMGYETVFAL